MEQDFVEKLNSNKPNCIDEAVVYLTLQKKVNLNGTNLLKHQNY